MIYDTNQSFPDQPFRELIPGYILFPFIMLCLSGVLVAKGFIGLILFSKHTSAKPAEPQK